MDHAITFMLDRSASYKNTDQFRRKIQSVLLHIMSPGASQLTYMVAMGQVIVCARYGRLPWKCRPMYIHT